MLRKNIFEERKETSQRKSISLKKVKLPELLLPNAKTEMKTDELKRKPKSNHMLRALFKTMNVKRLQQQQQDKNNGNMHRKTSYRKKLL